MYVRGGKKGLAVPCHSRIIQQYVVPGGATVKSSLLFGSLLFLAHTALAGSCLPGTLEDYILLGATGCNIGQVQYFNFELGELQAIATEINPAVVQITPGVPFPLGFLVTLNANANANDVLESVFRFNATSSPISLASIALGNPLVTGDGAITEILDLCADGNFLGIEPIGCSGFATNAVTFAIADDQQLSAQTNFPFSSFFDVFVDITIDGGLDGTASLDTAAVGLETPEPSSLFVLAVSLSTLGMVHSKRRRRS
jgi:hypothetical protein